MDKTVILELKGDLEQRGFYVTLHMVRHDGTLGTTFDGYLPPSAPLYHDLKQWQEDYRRLATPTRAIKPDFVRLDGTIYPIDACIASAKQLKQHFRQWLRADSFRDVELHLRQVLTPADIIQVIIRTGNDDAQVLPWHGWDFVEQYPKTEIALTGTRLSSGSNRPVLVSRSYLNILAVLGDRQNIDVESDRQTLNKLPSAHIEFLVEPSHQHLNDTLYDQRWDILFFAGHSITDADGQGILRLNATTTLTIDEIRYAMRRAIANGLQLAIFNSCNGLGLAHALTELQLPHMIVMREAVPDPVAQQFLKYFLGAFAQGQPLHLAQREARERLQGMEKEYPCASWLPILYQQSPLASLNWSPYLDSTQPLQNHEYNTLRSPSESLIAPPPWDNASKLLGKTTLPPTAQTTQRIPVLKRVGIALVSSVLAAGGVIGGRSLGFLQDWELRAYDHLMQLRPGQTTPDDRILIVAVSEEDIQYQRSEGMEMQGSLSDDALLLLLQKISPYNPGIVGLDIIHDFPFSPELQTQLAEQNLIAICRARNTASNLAGIAPPSETFPVYQLGFSNIPLDTDNVIRRQFLGMPPDEICPSEQSFSFRIAQAYLDKVANMTMEWLPSSSTQIQNIKLGSQIFPPLTRISGGYALSIGDAGGYQVLNNYRSAKPEYVPLRNIISGSMDTQLEELVRDRIILIGVIKPQVDIHQTPYDQRMPGVVVHSHMISTVISAALGERPLILWWAEGPEILWIVSWSVVGAAIIVVGRSLNFRVIGVLMGLALLWGICLILLVEGWWVPLVPSAIALGLTAVMASIMYKVVEH